MQDEVGKSQLRHVPMLDRRIPFYFHVRVALVFHYICTGIQEGANFPDGPFRLEIGHPAQHPVLRLRRIPGTGWRGWNKAHVSK